MMKTRFLTFVICTLTAAFTMTAPQFAAAQDGLVPASTEETGANNDLMRPTHPALKLTPERSEILNLSRAVDRVIIGNDANINVFMDTPTRLIVVPRRPGATHFTLMDENGMIVMQRHVIVASPRENYVRVRRTCAMGNSDSCVDTAVYYCEGMCHDVFIPSAENAGGGGEGDDLLAATGGASATPPGMTENPDAPPVE